MRFISIFLIVVVAFFGAIRNTPAQPAQIPEFVYRADTRAPNEVRRAGGFVARGVDASRPGTIADLSLYNHAIGHAGPQNDYSGYVSTTSDFMRGYRWLWDQGGGFRSGYVYTIRPTANFVDVNASLGRFLDPVIRQENEWAAMGRIHWYQVVGWRSVAEPPTTPMTPNPEYNPNHIAFTLPPAAVQPELAHFPLGHAAWNEMPWVEFTNCGRPPTGNRQQRAISASEQCIPFDNGNMDYAYYTGYLSALSSTLCGGACLEGDRSFNQYEGFSAAITFLYDHGTQRECNYGKEGIPESIAEIYNESLCSRMLIDDKLRVREGYLLKRADSTCTVIGTPDTQHTTGEICQPSTRSILETDNPVPGCPSGYKLAAAEDIEINSSICFTQLDIHSVARLDGENIVSGSERVPCVISKSKNVTQGSLCKKISYTAPEVVVSSQSPEGAVCWDRYTPVNVQQAMANKTDLCTLVIHSPTGSNVMGLADGWFNSETCRIWAETPPLKPVYTFCNNGVAEGNRFLSTMILATTGETCPSGFQLASESELKADPSICYGTLPGGSTARLANSASVTMSPSATPTTPLCTTKSSDPTTLTMAVCKAIP
jgi:Heat-labile enterotoxin alpha chain